MHSVHQIYISEPSSVLKKIEKSGWMILCLLSAGSLLFVSIFFAAGVALGGFLSLGNFYCADLYFRRLFQHEDNHIKWWYHVIYGLRFLVVLAAVAGSFAWFKLPIVSLVLGLSAPFMGILFFAGIVLAKGETGAKV